MDRALDNKMISDSEDSDEYIYRPNFITTPWDNRSKKSKIGIVCLLLAIFFATMACVINNIIMHYNSAAAARSRVSEKLKCNLEKIDKYSFVARIMSPNGDLICLGAIMSDTLVLTSEVCVKPGPILLLVGRPTLPLCKKGFLIDDIKPVLPPGLLSSNIVILKTVLSLSGCGAPIKVGSSLNFDKPVTLIGRAFSRSGRSLSRQTAILIKVHGEVPTGVTKNFHMDKVLCVRGRANCPVQAGDILIQENHIYGLASISIGGINVACFLDVRSVLGNLSNLEKTQI